MYPPPQNGPEQTSRIEWRGLVDGDLTRRLSSALKRPDRKHCAYLLDAVVTCPSLDAWHQSCRDERTSMWQSHVLYICFILCHLAMYTTLHISGYYRRLNIICTLTLDIIPIVPYHSSTIYGILFRPVLEQTSGRSGLMKAALGHR